VLEAFLRVLVALGVEVERFELPGIEHVTLLGGMLGAHELASGELGARASSPAGRMNVALGRSFAARDVARLDAQRAALRTATARVLERTPVLAMPTSAIPPPPLSSTLLAGGQDIVLLRAIGAFTPLANLVGLPAIAVPCGVDDRGRPLSIMFVTIAGGETALLELALAVERIA
jgi:aspartyl-tRNA(Asn)/glutamyl-tRNA(Gln) amidotransferase subunit A